METVDRKDLLALRERLAAGNETEVRNLLWKLGDEVGQDGTCSWNKARISEGNIRGLVLTWHWPEAAWSNENPGERIAWLEDWEAQHPGLKALGLRYQTEQALRAITERLPSDFLEVVGDHKAWRHMRTASSNGQNNILHLLSRTARDGGWLDGILARHGAWIKEHAPEGTSPAWRGALDRGREDSSRELETFRKHGHLTIENGSDDTEKVILAAAERGQLAQVLWVQETSGTGRILGVERRLATHRKLDGKRTPTLLASALANLEERWGELPQEEATEVWRALFNHHTLGIAGGGRAAGLTEIYEDRLISRGWWTPDLARHALHEMTRARQDGVLARYLERGFTFQEEDVDSAMAIAESPSWNGDVHPIANLLRRTSLAMKAMKASASARAGRRRAM